MMRNKVLPIPDVASDPATRMAFARLAVQGIAVKAAMHLAAEAGAVGYGEGARAPIGPARRGVELVELFELRGDNRADRLTPLGYSTARARLPRALSVLEDGDCRLQAALRYRHVVEKVAAVGGAGGLLDGPGGAGRVSDGGAVYHTGLAQELRAFVSILGGMALPRGNSRGHRSDITRRALVDGVVLGGQEIKGVLLAHGWSGKGHFVKVLTEALHDALSGMADVQEPH